MHEESKAYINKEGFLQIDYAPHVNFNNQADMLEHIVELVSDLEEKNIPLKVMTNLSQVIDYDLEAQGLSHRGIAEFNIIKTAAYGASPKIQKIHAALYEKGAKADRIRYFKTRDEALAWLRETP